jgi:hypothetical protein
MGYPKAIMKVLGYPKANNPNNNNNCIKNAAIVAGNTMKELISEIEVHTQNEEFELDELS